MNDDLFLLRLLLMDDPQLSELSYQSVRKLWNRFCVIQASDFVEVAAVGLFGQALELGLLGGSVAMKDC